VHPTAKDCGMGYLNLMDNNEIVALGKVIEVIM